MSVRYFPGIVCVLTVQIAGAGFVVAESPGEPSPTLNAPPPKNAIVLFDGKHLEAWRSQRLKRWEEADGPADWTIGPDGALEVVPGAGSLITHQRFGDLQLHLEFRLLGGETNGGVYLMSRYELAVNDSLGPGSPCGTFANVNPPIRPRVSVATPDRAWHTLDVDFRAPRLDEHGQALENARATVRLNGVTIHDDVELGPRRGAAKRLRDAARAPLMLQEHGAAYQFRNIWIVDRSR